MRSGAIYRIEAIFTYVPYFMHSPFYGVPSAPASVQDKPRAIVSSARVASEKCDRACLVKLADQYMDALVKRDPTGVPWAKEVRFTENSVPLMIGDGLWGSVRRKGDKAHNHQKSDKQFRCGHALIHSRFPAYIQLPALDSHGALK